MVKEQNEKEIKEFMRNIVYLRKYYHLSKKEMAKILKIGIGSLNKIEKGILPKRLSVNIVFCIEDYFKIPAKDQFKRIEN